MSTGPDAIQNLRSALEIGLNWLNASHITTEEFRLYFDDAVSSSFLPRAVAEAFAPITDRHAISEDDFKLVHYTSVDNLIKIMKSGYLRLWDSAHFNDPDEGRYLTRTTQWDHKAGSNWLSVPVEGHAYIASFIFPKDKSADIKNNLVFWRTYGKDGHGCSLEIPGGQFIGKDLPLLRVLYGSDEAQITMNELKKLEDESFADIRNVLDPAKGIVGENYLDEVIMRKVADQFEAISYLYKSKAYDYENECRLVVTADGMLDQPEYHYISSDSGHEDVRQYYEHTMLSAKNLLVSGTIITLGPSVKNKERIESYLKYLLDEAGLPGPVIEKSQIPYRG